MSTPASQVLVVEDDRDTRENLTDILELDGYLVRTAGSLKEATALDGWEQSAAVVLDRRLPDGLAEDELPQLTEAAPDAMFIIVTGHADLAGAIACLKRGAEDYILKPLNAEVFLAALRRAIEHRRAKIDLRRTEDQLRQTLEDLEKRVEQRTAELGRANAELRGEIAERTRAQKELLLLKDLALSIASEPGLDRAMCITLQKVCDATGWDCGEAWLLADDGKHLQRSTHWGDEGVLAPFYEASSAMRFGKSQGLPGRVWAKRKPIWMSDLSNERLFSRAAIAKSCGLTAAFGVPIFSGERLVAVVAFFLREWRAEDQRIQQTISAAVAPLGPVIERKRFEDQLASHSTELERLVAERTAQLRQADRLVSIGTLAAGLGHDIHNVLLPVRSRLDVMEADELPKRAREQLPAIRRAVSYLQELSDGLHLLALDPTDDDATGITTDLSEWWSQVGPLLGKTVPRRIAFQSSIDSNLPNVHVAPHRLTQAVLNLLVNASEAISSEGEVRMRAEAAEQSTHVRICVSDTGEGMTEEVRRRALDPFFTTKSRGLGTGLGLSLVQGVVQQAGGSISITSKPGRGTTVCLDLPAVAKRRSRDGMNRPLATVSVSDDRVAGFICTFLEAAGFEIAAIDDGLPRDSSVWVVDPEVTRLHTAKRFLRTGRKRRIIALGSPSEEWGAIGADVVKDAGDIDALRQAIRQAADAHANEDD